MQIRISRPIGWGKAKPGHVLLLDRAGNVIAEIPDPFAHLVCPLDIWEEPTEADMRYWEERCNEIWDDLLCQYPSIRCLAEMVIATN